MTQIDHGFSVELSKIKIVVRSAGDLATGTIQKLVRSGFSVIALEAKYPTAIRRGVALSSALFESQGQFIVEDMVAIKCNSPSEALDLAGTLKDKHYVVPILIDPEGIALEEIKPHILVDAILAKRNCGTTLFLAPWVIALGPGFTAGVDADIVIETMRGHDLGRLIFQGMAIPNTMTPGIIGGQGYLRVLRSPCSGRVVAFKAIGDIIEEGELILEVEDEKGLRHPVTAPFDGLIRGLIPDGFLCPSNYKIGDVDPRKEEKENYMRISDKARNIAGGVLEAVLMGLNQERKK